MSDNVTRLGDSSANVAAVLGVDFPHWHILLPAMEPGAFRRRRSLKVRSSTERRLAFADLGVMAKSTTGSSPSMAPTT